MNKRLTTIILAAGKGTRMGTPLPKVVHPVAGTPMISRAIVAAQAARSTEVRVVVGYGEALVRQLVEPLGAVCLRQENQTGTADAVKSAQPESIEGTVLILNGDHPLITADDIKKIVTEFEAGQSFLTVLTCEMKNPGSFGRIVRNNGELQAIVEAKDASKDTLKITEVNTGIYIGRAETIQKYLPQISNNNAQGEYYFTDIIELCKNDGVVIGANKVPRRVAFGVNSQLELAKANKYIFKQTLKKHLDKGVMIVDPQNTYIEDSVEIGPATVIYPGNFLKGNTTIGSFCVIEPNCFILNSKIGESVQIKSGTYMDDAVVGTKSSIGPYAHLRPKTQIAESAKVGNFVELKNVKFGKGAKASHLTYLGDAEIGEGTNIGCGTITCNYSADKKKYQTIIGKNVFVGSDTQFVAPIVVGDNAIIGSGSTVTKDVPKDALAVARGKQIIKEGYAKKLQQQSSVSEDAAKG